MMLEKKTSLPPISSVLPPPPPLIPSLLQRPPLNIVAIPHFEEKPRPSVCRALFQSKEEMLSRTFNDELQIALTRRTEINDSLERNSPHTLPRPRVTLTSLNSKPTRLHSISQSKFKDSIQQPELGEVRIGEKKVKWCDLVESEL
jgi:hypothetical protein